jgi:dihydropteroate synthase
MGILNVTPDSFADGGQHDAADTAVARIAAVAAQGASICDIGAESTRPGAAPVGADEELRRLAPVFTAMRSGSISVPISIDTRHAVTAAAALDAGAVLVNDVSAGGDPDMLPLVADRGAGICLMHMRGDPQTMQDDPRYDDVVGEVAAFLEARLAAAVDAGVPDDAVLLDPGIGFGKSLDHNVALLSALPRLAAIGRPLVVGASRKGVIGQITGREVVDRLPGSLGAALAAVAGGASVVRVHDVAATVDALAVFQAIRGEGEQ